MLGYKEISCPEMSIAEICMFRWMCSNTRRDKVRNEHIRAKISIASVKEKKRENRLRGFSHVRCKSTDASVRQLERIKLGQVKRAQGRLKKHGWMIRLDIEAKGLNKGILLDRKEWIKQIHVPDLA